MWPASTHIIGLCLSLSIHHWLTGSESPDSAVNHNRNQGGLDLMAWAGVVGVGTELKMDKRKKRPGGTEKLRWKLLNVQILQTYLVPGSTTQQVLLRQETSEWRHIC